MARAPPTFAASRMPATFASSGSKPAMALPIFSAKLRQSCEPISPSPTTPTSLSAEGERRRRKRSAAIGSTARTRICARSTYTTGSEVSEKLARSLSNALLVMAALASGARVAQT